MSEEWISDRMHLIDASGIRKVFDLAANMKNPINLSIGQPHFDTPDIVKEALCQAVMDGKNSYSQSQGIAPLIENIQSRVDAEYDHDDRQVFISSGTSGALMLVLNALINPGDEVIVFDPFFVMYSHLVKVVGGKLVFIETYPDFSIDIEKVRESITDRTKLILFNSPSNPTGHVASESETRALAELAAEKNIALVSDEIYRAFCYDQPFVSPATFNENVIVIDGFSKSHSMTGHRLGFVHGPSSVIQQMIKLQQYTFVCAPHPSQWAGLAALDYDISDRVDEYHQKRNLMRDRLADKFEISGAQGAFYMFLKTPWGTGTEFCTEAIKNNLLIIPGNVFSNSDTHIRISYAQENPILEQGAEILNRLADQGM